jgi:hypothetical protein
MPNPSRAKGDRAERELVRLHTEAGIECLRVPLSGSMKGFKGDLRIGREGLTGEVKARRGGEGFKTLEAWLGDNDVLILKKDRAAPMVVMNWPTYIKLMAGR